MSFCITKPGRGTVNPKTGLGSEMELLHRESCEKKGKRGLFVSGDWKRA